MLTGWASRTKAWTCSLPPRPGRLGGAPLPPASILFPATTLPRPGCPPWGHSHQLRVPVLLPKAASLPSQERLGRRRRTG